MATIPNLVTVDLDESRVRAVGGDVGPISESLLDALDRSKTAATFFIPQSVAETRPEIARRITARGHEVGCLTTTKPAASKPYCSSFANELTTTKSSIEDATGARVRGHRNATFAVDRESEWVYDVLVDQGFDYDSSRFPRRYVEAGYQPVPRTVHAVRRWGGTLLEIPVSTADVMATRVQLGATSTVRGIPLVVWSALVEDRQLRGEPLVMHIRASELARTRPFARKDSAGADRRTIERVSNLSTRFSFTSVANALPALLRAAPIIEC